VARHPRDNKGQFVPLKCELCGCGALRHDGSKTWRCDGLLDPEDPNKKLEACWGYHFDGEPRVPAVARGVHASAGMPL
jgi:hypothetical protein